MAFSDAWNEIKGKVSDEAAKLKSYFKKDKGSNAKLYPRELDEKLIQEVKKENWNKSLNYSFQVVTQGGEIVDEFKEFTLQIAPQNMQQDELFAVTITPTQDAVITESNGIVFRDLVISGTTGVHPLRGATGAKADGRTLSAPNARTGYEEFHHLRNYMRAYALHKKNPLNRFSLMVFKNRKDNEVLIVEPLKFGMKRQGPRSRLYDYDIQFKVIGSLDFKDVENAAQKKGFFASLQEVVGTINTALDDSRAVLLRGSDLLRQVEREINTTIFEPLRKMDLLIKTLGGIKSQLGDMGDGIVARFNSSLTLQTLQKMKDDPTIALSGVILPVNEFKASQAGGSALLAVRKDAFLKIEMDEGDLPAELSKDFASERSSAMALPKSFFEDLQKEVQRVADNLTEFVGLGDPTYNTYAGRSQTFTPSPTKQTTSQELELLASFTKINQALNLLISYGNDHFASNLSDKLTFDREQFNNNISLPLPSAVNEVIIAPGQSLEDIALAQLGDFERWTEIAELNNLIPPYITDDMSNTNKRIKKFGDRIMIPSEGTQIDTNVRVVRDDKYNNKLTETEKRLGIDIKLSDNFDFILTNNNDFDVITGGSNAGQAIRVKFNLTKGDLKYHKSIGLGLIVGEKVTTADQLYDEIVNTILQDPRFEQINSFDLLIDGNAIVVKLNLNVVENATPVPLELNL